MIDFQPYFEQFHKAIRTDYEMSETLRKKRDIILGVIQAHLQKNDRPGVTPLNQGSYIMKTGVVPLKGFEYDIDLGLRFQIKDTDYTAKTVRQWVLDAIAKHTAKVEPKGPCIRVIYAEGYHVDLVCYACWEDDAGQELYRLAHKSRGWIEADPPKLKAYVREKRKRFAGTEDSETQTDQFRRVVRYLRRWSDIHLIPYPSTKPAGLAFVLLAAERLMPVIGTDGGADDLTALELLVDPLSKLVGRIVAKKPTPEYEDMFGRLTDEAMEDLKERLGTMVTAIRTARSTDDPSRGCSILQEVFGPDFPVPPAQETAKATSGPAIVPAVSSA